VRRNVQERRHLTDAQRVIAGEAIEPDLAAVARARQAHGQTAPGKTVPDTG
jgi:hypothetical protein